MATEEIESLAMQILDELLRPNGKWGTPRYFVVEKFEPKGFTGSKIDDALQFLKASGLAVNDDKGVVRMFYAVEFRQERKGKSYTTMAGVG